MSKPEEFKPEKLGLPERGSPIWFWRSSRVAGQPKRAGMDGDARIWMWMIILALVILGIIALVT